jgi:hypothetical protein
MTAFKAPCISALRLQTFSGYNLTTVKTLRWLALLTGIAAFAASFALPAVKEAKASSNSAGVPGFTCATITLQMPWSNDGRTLLHESPLQYFSILFSGWINPLFLVTLVMVLIKPRWRPTIVLGYLVAAMQVFCWILFFQLHLFPRQGYFLWLSGMLLALYSNKISRS